MGVRGFALEIHSGGLSLAWIFSCCCGISRSQEGQAVFLRASPKARNS